MPVTSLSPPWWVFQRALFVYFLLVFVVRYYSTCVFFFSLLQHGDMEQKERDVIMREFRSGSSRVLITTDLLVRSLESHN